jgi:hypothetical protein
VLPFDSFTLAVHFAPSTCAHKALSLSLSLLLKSFFFIEFKLVQKRPPPLPSSFPSALRILSSEAIFLTAYSSIKAI